MTSQELEEVMIEKGGGISLESIILEIAYQLALMNERMDREDKKFFGGLPTNRDKKETAR